MPAVERLPWSKALPKGFFANKSQSHCLTDEVLTILLSIRNCDLIASTVLAIDLAGLVAGTGIRGSFESKLKDLLEDIQDEKGQSHLFHR